MPEVKTVGWEYEPYHVHVDITIEAPGGLAER